MLVFLSALNNSFKGFFIVNVRLYVFYSRKGNCFGPRVIIQLLSILSCSCEKRKIYPKSMIGKNQLPGSRAMLGWLQSEQSREKPVKKRTGEIASKRTDRQTDRRTDTDRPPDRPTRRPLISHSPQSLGGATITAG